MAKDWEFLSRRWANTNPVTLPKAKQQSAEWQAAAEALLMAAEDRGPLMHAHVGMMLALHGAKPIPEYDSSWMPPGANWEGTPYESIYQVTGQDETAAALIFGQIVWETFQERPENWYQQEAGEINGRLVKGRTYFMARA